MMNSFLLKSRDHISRHAQGLRLNLSSRSNRLRVDILTFFSVTDPALLELAEFGGVYAIPNQLSKGRLDSCNIKWIFGTIGFEHKM